MLDSNLFNKLFFSFSERFPRTITTWHAGTAARFLSCVKLRSQITLTIYFTTANPHLDSYDSYFRKSLRMTIVNIGTECVQWSTAFLIHLRTSDFRTVQTTGNENFYTLGTHAHRVCDSEFDSTAVSHFTLDFARYVMCDNHSIKIRAFHLEDVYLNILVSDFFQLLLQLINILPSFTDNHTRTGSADGNSNKFQRTFNYDSRKTGIGKTDIEIFPDLTVFE